MNFLKLEIGKGKFKSKKPHLSILSSMQADWIGVLIIGFVSIVSAIYFAQIEFDNVSDAVTSAQSRKEGRATLVVPEAREMIEVFSGRALAPSAASTSTSATSTPQAKAPAA